MSEDPSERTEESPSSLLSRLKTRVRTLRDTALANRLNQIDSEYVEEGARRITDADLDTVVERAEERDVTAAFEPEPGHLTETVGSYQRLTEHTPGLRLALDTGHCLVTQDIAPAEAVRAYADRLGTVAIEDMQRGVHQHLPFGEGDMDVPAVLKALRDTGFDRLVCVELSRASPTAHEAIPQSIEFLKTAERQLAHR